MKNLLTKIITPFLVAGALFGKVQAQDNQINPFHQPNIVYDQLNSYGGGDYTGQGIDQGDVNAANAGTDDYRLDVNGDEQVNTQDGATLQNYVDGNDSKLPSWWNFSTKEEKVDWLDKMLAIDKTDTTSYVPGEFISGDFGAQLYLNFQGYPVKSQEEMELIAQKYDTTNFGKYNIPVYHVAISTPTFNHGGAASLKGGNPLNFYDWQFIEPQLGKDNDLINLGENWNLPIGSKIRIDYFKELRNSNGKPSFSTENLVKFKIDSTGIPILDGDPNPNLFLTEPNVATEDEKSTPENYSLGNNYPNPFNPTTTINYYVPQEGNVKIYIYDISGRVIATLSANINISGSNKVEWNASGFPSGIYFYQLRNNLGVIATKRMLLMK